MSSLVQAKCTNSSAGPSSASSFSCSLDEVLHRLDVVVGGALDLLHARGLGRAEVGGQRAQAGDGGVGERGQFDDARLGGQGQQPFHLDHDAGLDQAIFGEDRAQGVDLAGVTAIKRGQGEQGGIVLVGRAGTSGGGNILRRAGVVVRAAGRVSRLASYSMRCRRWRPALPRRAERPCRRNDLARPRHPTLQAREYRCRSRQPGKRHPASRRFPFPN